MLRTTPADLWRNPMALADLTHDLDAAEPRRRIGAAWDAFDLGQRAADAAVFTHGTDDIAALAAAAACATGRALLPLPSDGGPHLLPDTDAPAVCAALLELIQHGTDDQG